MLHPVMPGLIGYPNMWVHQQRVFEAVRQGRHVLVATGTGSGKTEAFLYPIVDDLLRQRDGGIAGGPVGGSGLSHERHWPTISWSACATCWPGTNITFRAMGRHYADNERDVTIERFTSSSRPAYLAERQKRKEEAVAENGRYGPSRRWRNAAARRTSAR